jgi:hypothetical protein
VLQGTLRKRVTGQFDPRMRVEIAAILANAELQHCIEPALAQQGPQQQGLREAWRIEYPASPCDCGKVSEAIGLLHFGGRRLVRCGGPDHPRQPGRGSLRT